MTKKTSVKKRYFIAKTIAIFFSTTTVVLFVMSREGILFAITGTNLGVLLYILNFILLMAALIVFAWWQAIYKNARYHDDLSILEHVDDSPNGTPTTPKVLVDNETFLTLSKTDDNQEVTVATKPKFAALKKGAVIEVISSPDQTSSFRALTIEIDHNHLFLRKLPRAEK